MGPTLSKDTAEEGIVTVSHHGRVDPDAALRCDPLILGLQQLAQDLPEERGTQGAKGPREIALQEELKLSALVKDASEALAADVEDSIAQYRSWASGRLRQAATKQLLVHLKIDEAASRATDAEQHLAKLINVASGVNHQLNALAKLPEQIEGLCTQLWALQQQCEQLQSRAAVRRVH